MDNALCGGAGDTLTGAALNAVKAAVFLGDPHYRVGLPYNVGTCQAQGVSAVLLCSKRNFQRLGASANEENSSLLVLQASRAPQPPATGSSPTATLLTPTAAMETTPIRISSTSSSMVPRP